MSFGKQCDEATSFAIMDAAVDQGVDFFDTADGYPCQPDAEPSALRAVGNTVDKKG